nr:MAG TPA: hypothetical protein [Bacteriophage sp.]
MSTLDHTPQLSGKCLKLQKTPKITTISSYIYP